MRSSSLRVEDLIVDAFEALVVTDANDRILLWTPGAKRLLGWEDADTIGRDLGTLAGLATLETREPDEDYALLSLCRQDGLTVIVRARKRTLADGRILHRYIDVSAEYAWKREAEEMDARVGRITRTMGDGLATVDFEGRIQFLNARAEPLLGVAAANALHLRLAEAISELAADPTFEPALRKALRERVETSFDVYVARTDRHIEVTTSPTPAGAAIYMRDVTDRVMARLDAQARRDELELLLSELPLAILRIGRNGHVLYANRMAERLSGYTREQIVGRKLGREVRPLLSEAVRAAIDTETPRRFDVEYESTLGLRHFRVQVLPARDETGQVGSVVVIAHDVTEQITSETMFRALFERSPDAHFLIDGSIIADCNGAAVSILGMPREALRGRSPLEFMPEYQHDGVRSVDRLRDIRDRLAQTGDATFEWTFRSRNGSETVCEIHLNQIRTAGKSVTLGIAYDIGARKAAEKRLRESEGRYRAIVDNASELIYSISIRGRILFVSPSIVANLGYTPEDLIGRSLVDLLRPDDLAAFSTYRRNLMRNAGKDQTVEFQVRDAQGRYRHFATRGAIVTAGNGRPLYFVGAAHDIEEHIRLAKALAEARDAAEAGSRAKSQFIAMVSHEIRTPLNGVLATADLLTDTPMTDEQDMLVRTIRGSGQTLLRVLNDVLDLSKAEAGGLTILRTPTNLVAAVEEVVSLFRARAQDRGLRLVSEWVGPTDRFVMADVVRVKQILGNLVHNALKFTPAGQIEVRSRLRREDADRYVFHVRVSDTGIGIAADRLDAVFDSFAQAEETTHATYGGTGLGLTICRMLVHAMGGTIWAESELGRGSRFHLVLEVSSARSSSTPLPEPHPGPISAKILVAEDNDVNAMVTRRHLERLGCSVTVVPNGILAIESLAHARYDLVLLDLHMPGMDGCSTARAIRSAGLQDVPIIALTASSSLEDRQACLESGMNDVLIKPFTSGQLAETLIRHLRKR